MDARPPGVADGGPGTVDIGRRGTGEAGDDGGLALFGDGGDGFEIAFGGDGEPGLDDVDAERFELGSDLQFLLEVHRAAGRLLAVSERGVENADMVGHVMACLKRVPGRLRKLPSGAVSQTLSGEQNRRA